LSSPMRRVLLLSEKTTRNQLDDAIGAADLRLVNLVAAAEGRPRQIAAATADGQSAVSFVHDVPARMLYAIVDGADTERLCNSLARALGTRSRASIDKRILDALATLGPLWQPKT
jgi:hypothetical protein